MDHNEDGSRKQKNGKDKVKDVSKDRVSRTRNNNTGESKTSTASRTRDKAALKSGPPSLTHHLDAAVMAKALLLAAKKLRAKDLGYSGATKLVDIAKTYKYEKNGKELKWQPKNYSKNYKGLITLREALIHSSNLATINLVNDIGLNQLLGEFKKFGIKNVPKDLSISLGTISLSPLELAKYYTSFANNGIQMQTHLIDKIVKDSVILYKKELKSKFITTPTQAFIMTTILRDVVKRGTGIRARVRGIELAGKTGTTNKNVDGWFAGYSPTMETIVWFGNDDNTPMHKKETGGRIAGPAFSAYYKKVLKYYPYIKRKFDKPDGIIEVQIRRGKEYFSNISKPPREEKDEQEELLF